MEPRSYFASAAVQNVPLLKINQRRYHSDEENCLSQVKC